MTDPADRAAVLRDHLAAEAAKLPAHTPNGNHDGGTSRFYVDATPEPQELDYADTTSGSYDADGRGDQAHETVNMYRPAEPAAEQPAEHTAEQPRRPRNVPKPDPSQGGSGGTRGTSDTPERAQREGRWRDAIHMLNQGRRA